MSRFNESLPHAAMSLNPERKSRDPLQTTGFPAMRWDGVALSLKLRTEAK